MILHLLTHGPKATLLDDEFLEAALGVGRHEQGLLNSRAGSETKDDNGPGLTDTVAAILGLEILLGIKVGVEEDDCISRSEVDALAASTSRQEEDLIIRVIIEGLNLVASVLLRYRAVDTAGFPAPKFATVVFENVELGGELREDENFVASVEEGW